LTPISGYYIILYILTRRVRIMETRQVVLEGASLKALMDIATELREQRYTMRETNCHIMETNRQLGKLVEVIKLAQVRSN
tara:strand:- start:171 stop:410 length:240 start_codon:yes stop_codon:yes gene_type:complete